MTANVEVAAGPNDAWWLSQQRRWANGWRATVFPAVFLAYLVQTGGAVADSASGAVEVLGFAVLGAFCVAYIICLEYLWADAAGPAFWVPYGAAAAMLALEIPIAHDPAFVMANFVVVVSIARFQWRAFPIVAGLLALDVVLPAVVPSWHGNWSTAVDNGTAIAVPMVSLAMFGFFNVVRSNQALAEARAELTRLAAENERIRIARDLHDLLGHSLTTIAVKSELAHRIAGNDLAAAAREIGEVADLSRRALADVRAAVANYREVTVAGELATGRELLRAAGIAGDLPVAVGEVDAGAQELFGWVLREGITNVVRHSRAATCRVRISPDSVDIVDDGRGNSLSRPGNGLAGLRERVAAAGGSLESGPADPVGWRLHVSLPRSAQ